MPKSPAGYLHLAGACCVGQATEILCSSALQGKQLLQAVWSCLYTGLPWKSPCLTALHTHMSRVYFSGTWFVSPLPSHLAGDWQEILGWGSSVDVGCKLIYVYGEGLFSAAWILSRCKRKQVVFMGMSNRNMALELLSTLSLIPVTEQWSPRCVKGMPPTSNRAGLCFRTWQLYPAMLSCQSGKNESFLFPFVIWRWLKPVLIHLKFSSC